MRKKKSPMVVHTIGIYLLWLQSMAFYQFLACHRYMLPFLICYSMSGHWQILRSMQIEDMCLKCEFDIFDGLFLFMVMTSLYGNQMFERALLLVTEQVGRISNSFVTGLCPNRVQLSQMSKVHLSHIVLLSGRAFQSYVPGFLRFRVSS